MISGINPLSSSKVLSAWRSVVITGESSCAISAGRRITSIFWFPAYPAISSSSVDMTIFVNNADFFAARIEYSINGFPANSRIFFFGIPLLPPGRDYGEYFFFHVVTSKHAIAITNQSVLGYYPVGSLDDTGSESISHGNFVLK